MKMIKHLLKIKDNTARLWLAVIGLLVGILACLLYHQKDTNYPEDYGQARKKLEETEETYQSQLKELWQKQDSLENQLAALDTVREAKEEMLRPVLQEMAGYARAGWQQLTEEEKSEWTELAIKSIAP